MNDGPRDLQGRGVPGWLRHRAQHKARWRGNTAMPAATQGHITPSREGEISHHYGNWRGSAKRQNKKEKGEKEKGNQAMLQVITGNTAAQERAKCMDMFNL